jgi:hypothetical protein
VEHIIDIFYFDSFLYWVPVVYQVEGHINTAVNQSILCGTANNKIPGFCISVARAGNCLKSVRLDKLQVCYVLM